MEFYPGVLKENSRGGILARCFGPLRMKVECSLLRLFRQVHAHVQRDPAIQPVLQKADSYLSNEPSQSSPLIVLSQAFDDLPSKHQRDDFFWSLLQAR